VSRGHKASKVFRAQLEQKVTKAIREILEKLEQ
jgi:hypothetical protein